MLYASSMSFLTRPTDVNVCENSQGKGADNCIKSRELGVTYGRCKRQPMHPRHKRGRVRFDIAKINTAVYFVFCLIFFQSCHAQPSLKTGSNDPAIEYMGRVDRNDSSAILYWSGSSVTINYTGGDVKVRLRDEKGDNYFYSIIDGRQIIKIHPDTTAKDYFLTTNLPKGKHKLQLFKLTEGTMGKTWFYGFEISGDARLLPPGQHKRKMEFYGNSITAGYGVDDNIADSRSPEYFNNYCTYAAITARHYDATYYNISKSGIGLMVSWFPVIMPEMYDRTDPNDTASKWDFTRYTPDIVVIDLLQNDSWLIYRHDHRQFKARFGTVEPDSTMIVSAYRAFVHTIRSKYPKAQIVCTLGSMDATREGSIWPVYVRSAVAAVGDPKIHTYFFPFINTRTHPKRKHHQAMAEGLIAFIDQLPH